MANGEIRAATMPNGMKATPATSGENPSTVCICVMTKNIVPTMGTIASTMMVRPAASLRRSYPESGPVPSRNRRMITISASTATPAAIRQSAEEAPQPS